MANAITLFRLSLLPLVFYLIITGSGLAVVVFGLAALTDLFDGFVARSTGTVTEFGKFLDPLTDRLLIVSSVTALYLRDNQPALWIILLLVLRDAVLFYGYWVLRKHDKKLDVIMMGKAATALLMLGFTLMIMKSAFGIWIFYLGAILYMLAGFNYYIQGKKLLNNF
ncbi:MAG TPA: CDP-alcohol phosphatidyltransferase family protein [Actinobacteria bacterium]|nr:CDP-alcohol phosphatidyltransferase family protein [Actinomycetes bacterium]HEX21143.1 CDP-alcohol phosphatidyltransferase family protein [Actinomycetota bacterium]